MSTTLRHLRRLVFCLVALMPAAHAQEKELMIYCGITMVRPITELARQFEQHEKVTRMKAQRLDQWARVAVLELMKSPVDAIHPRGPAIRNAADFS